MSKIFGSCPSDICRAPALPSDEIVMEEVERDAATFSKRQEKLLKKVRKLLKRQNHLLKKMKCQGSGKKTSKEKNGWGGKEFFQELGKAFCKAVPIVLTTVVTSVVKFITSGRRKSGWQFA